MNCQDIFRTLESRNVNALAAEELRACEAHAASCPRCGAEWIAYTRLAAIPVPAIPHTLAVQCEALVEGIPAAAGKYGNGRRTRNRFLLVGALVALSAAAAMIEVVPRVVAESRAPESAERNEVSPEAVAEGNATAATTPVAPAPGRFTVHLRSLQYDSPDAAAVRKVQEYHTLLAEGLRAVPGLQLLDDAAVARAGAPATYRITIASPDAAAARQALSNNHWTATYHAEVLKAAGAGALASSAAVYVAAEGVTRGGMVGPEPFAAKTILVPHSGECGFLVLCTAQRIVEWQIKDLRMQVFPLDGSIQHELEARFLDPSLPPAEHFQALNDLQAVTKRAGSVMSDAVVREALSRVDRTSNAEDRNLYWAFLAGQRHPGIIPLLVEAAQEEPDEDARRAAVLQMATDFPDDPAVLVALQSVARDDPKLLNRKIAERILLGESSWNEYVIASMKDTHQTIRQRFEPLLWMVGQRSSLAPLADAVFGEDAQVFINLFVQAGRERYRVATRALVAFSSMDHPGVAAFVLSVFDAIPDHERLMLLERQLGDPDVRARVEQIATGPSDEILQVAARGMLERAARK